MADDTLKDRIVELERKHGGLTEEVDALTKQIGAMSERRDEKIKLRTQLFEELRTLRTEARKPPHVPAVP